MSTVNATLTLERGYLGTRETGTNVQPFSAALGRPPEYWCADFQEFCLRQAGVLPKDVPGSPGAGELLRQFDAAGRGIAPDKVQPGDLVGFAFPGEGGGRWRGICHVGMVEQVRSYSPLTVVTLEGNTNSVGSRDGGGVERKIRRAFMAAFGRPDYDQLVNGFVIPPGIAHYPTVKRNDVGHGSAVQLLQGMLNAWRHNRRLSEHAVDGRFDQWTEIALRTFQKTYGLPVDGTAGPITWTKLLAITKGAHRP